MEPQSVPARGGRENDDAVTPYVGLCGPGNDHGARSARLRAGSTGYDSRKRSGRTAGRGLQRNRRHGAGPRAAAFRRAARHFGSQRRNLGQFGRQRHPPAQPGRAFAARLLDRQRGQRLRAHPRNRDGRRQSRPRKLGRGVHRRRLSLAFRHRPQRARRNRARGGAARAAGHLVWPQRLGRPDPHHQQAAFVHLRRHRRGDLWQLRSCPVVGRADWPDHRDARGADRRRLRQAPWLLRRSRQRRGRQQPQPLFRARTIVVPAEQRSQHPADRRLYQARRTLLRRGLCRPQRQRICR